MSNRVFGFLWFIGLLSVAFAILYGTFNPELAVELTGIEQAGLVLRQLVDILLGLFIGMLIGVGIIIAIFGTIVAVVMIWTGESIRKLLD